MKSSELKQSLDLYEIMPGKLVPWESIRTWLPTVEVALFFAKAYNFNYTKLSELLFKLFKTNVMDELMNGTHSVTLQDYLVDTVPTDVYEQAKPDLIEKAPPAEVLPEVWKMAEVEIAHSLKEVATKLAGSLHLLPSKQGSMVFKTMAKVNSQRPTIGVHKAAIVHEAVPDVLVIFDVSGSMTEQTVRALVNEVVALSWEANASLAIVSDHCFYWEPGSYNVNDVLEKAEYWGTHYETLAPLFSKDWGTVVTIADYDSSYSAKSTIANCAGRIGTVLDISLVNQPTFLAECVGQLADKVQPLLIGRHTHPGFLR